MKWRRVRRGRRRGNDKMKVGGVVTVFIECKKHLLQQPFQSIRVKRNVQQWIMKVHQCQLSFILITNTPHLLRSH